MVTIPGDVRAIPQDVRAIILEEVLGIPEQTLYDAVLTTGRHFEWQLSGDRRMIL